MTNRRRNAIYCGVTDELEHEVMLHRTRRAGHLVGKRHLTHVLWTKDFFEEADARATCEQIRKWPREKKIKFVEAVNPEYTCVLAARRRMFGNKPTTYDWRKMTKKGKIGPDGPTELAS